MSDASKAPVAEKTASTVDLLDAGGNAIGVTVRLKATKESIEPNEDETKEHLRLRTIAKNVTSFSAMEVDGEPWTFSQERAVVLFHRFPHFADQIDGALKKVTA